MVEQLHSANKLGAAARDLGLRAESTYKTLQADQQKARSQETAGKADQVANVKRNEALTQKLAKPTVNATVKGSVFTVENLNEAQTLKRLWSCSRPARFFDLVPEGATLLETTQQEALIDDASLQSKLEDGRRIDYFAGRCIKTDLSQFPKVDLESFKRQCEIEGSYQQIAERCFNNP